MSFPLTVKPGDKLPPLHVQITAAHVVGSAIASRDWQPQHHDRDHAVRAKLPDIILNTPSQLGWFCRYATDWCGPHGRVGRTKLEMRRPICPGDALAFGGVVEWAGDDSSSGRWIELSLTMARGPEVVSSARLMLALPTANGVNPWKVKGADWAPPHFQDSP